MTDDTDERQHTVSRREFLAGGAAVGAAFLGGGATTRMIEGEVFPATSSNHIADRIYTGSSAISLDLPDGVGVDFFSQTTHANRGDMQLIFSAHEYPTGDLVERSGLDLDIYIPDDLAELDDEEEESVLVTANPTDSSLIDHVEADGQVAQSSLNGLHELGDGGRLYNLVEGADGDPVARLQTRVSPRTDILEGTDSPVVFAFRLADRDSVKILRQTPPIDVETGGLSDRVTVPTRGRRYRPESPDTPKFRRVTREGRHLIWYNWRAGTEKYQLVYPVHKLSYAAARNRDTRYSTETYRDAHGNPYGRELGRAIYQMAASKGGSKPTESRAFTLARRFGQSWPYVKDIKTHDEVNYANYVEETLVEGAGDCEDMAMLMVSIFSQPPFEYDVAMLFPPKHLALGIAADDLPQANLPPRRERESVFVGDTEYVYIETTAVKPPGQTTRDLTKARGVYNGEWHRINPQSLTAGLIRYMRTILG